MTLPLSGPLSVGDIKYEMRRNYALRNTNSDYSLRTLSSLAGKSTPDRVTDFYGYTGPQDMNVSVYEPGGEFWSPCYSGPTYLGGWYVDHYAFIYNVTTNYTDTLTFGGTRNYTFVTGETISITSSLRNISYDTSCPKVYQVYLSLNGTDVASTNVNLGGNGDATYTFTLAIGGTYNLTAWIRDIS